MTSTARRAFTLIEVLLVVSLLAMLAAFAWPRFDTAEKSERLKESTRRLATLMAMCRATAMNEGCIYHISIRQDGTLSLWKQVDPIISPQDFGPVKADWADTAFLLDDVWVESVVPLPEGPPPVLVKENEQLVQYGDKDYDLSTFDPDLNFDPILVQQLELPVVVEFRPDGTSDSLRWTLRDARGFGVEMTLDGRLGRVTQVEVERLPEDSVERPAPVEDKKDQDKLLQRTIGEPEE